jgi:hypothetical protein
MSSKLLQVMRFHLDRQYNNQQKKDKKTNNDRQNTTQKTNDWAVRTTMNGSELRKGKQFLFHQRHPPHHLCHKSDVKSWMRTGRDCDYDMRKISVVTCDTDIWEWLKRQCIFTFVRCLIQVKYSFEATL